MYCPSSLRLRAFMACSGPLRCNHIWHPFHSLTLPPPSSRGGPELSWVVRDPALGEADDHAERIVPVEDQRLRALPLEALLFGLQEVRCPLEIRGLEGNGIDTLAGLLQVAAFGARRRQRLGRFNHSICADGEKGAPFLPGGLLFMQQLAAQDILVQGLGLSQVSD